MPHSCSDLGHVLVPNDQEPEVCLVCGKLTTTDDMVGRYVKKSTRAGGELTHRDDTASVAEWGPANTGHAC